MKTARLAIGFAVLLVLCSFSAHSVPAAKPKIDDSPFYAELRDAASFKLAADVHLEKAQRELETLLDVKPPRTVLNTLRLYDDLTNDVAAASAPANIIAAVHPDTDMRLTAEDILQRVRAFASDLQLNRGLYDALAAIDTRSANAETKFYLERELRSFRLAGVDKDDAVRDRLKDLQRQLAAASQEFQRNIRSNTRTVVVKDASELAGLPADYIARHKPNADGSITIGTDNADARPVLTFATHDELRRKMYVEMRNIGYPANLPVLDKMIALRSEIAHLVGYDNWAAYDMVDRMSGSLMTASDFIDRIAEASRAKAETEYGEILNQKKAIVPGATVVNPWESAYYAEQVRKAKYDFDSQSVRAYFAYDRVRQGVFDVTSKLFGVTYRPAKNIAVWHPSVEVFEMLQDNKPIGRFYLDMHARANKANTGATTYTIRSGIAQRQLPEVVIVASVSGGKEGDPGLMTHDEVRTFFHEFGHLVHAMMSGRHEWRGVARVAERDFVEAPSQMLEEWIWDPATLATFARHYQTNQPIPASLVAQMRHASEFGKGLDVRQQMVYAKLSLSLHDRDPKTVDSTALLKEITNRYMPYPFVDGTHMQAAFTHLANANYTASYYTYMWSLVIAKDFFSRFDSSNLLAEGIARRYRDQVLSPGGAKPAGALVQDFLGRPFSEKAWTDWLNN